VLVIGQREGEGVEAERREIYICLKLSSHISDMYPALIGSMLANIER